MMNQTVCPVTPVKNNAYTKFIHSRILIKMFLNKPYCVPKIREICNPIGRLFAYPWCLIHLKFDIWFCFFFSRLFNLKYYVFIILLPCSTKIYFKFDLAISFTKSFQRLIFTNRFLNKIFARM